MHLIYIAGKDPTKETGGHSSYVRAHARVAMRLGYAPQIFCVSREEGLVETEYGVVHRVRSPFRPYRPILVPLHDPFIRRAILRYLNGRHESVLVHGFGFWSYIGTTTAREIRRRDVVCHTVASLYTAMVDESAGKWEGINRSHPLRLRLRNGIEYLWARLVLAGYERRLLQQTDLLLTNYLAVERKIQEAQGSEFRLRKVPYASERSLMGDAELPAELTEPGAPLIVSVSRHDPRKGVDVLIRALAELRESGVAFRAILVGGGPLLESHRRLVDRLGLADCTQVAGWVDDSYEYLRRAEIFVLPSIQEGSGSVSLLEAMQAGVACVTSRIDGIPEDVTDGESALLFEVGQVEELAAILEKLLQASELRQRLGRAARQAYEQNFSAARLMEALQDIYTQLPRKPREFSSFLFS